MDFVEQMCYTLNIERRANGKEKYTYFGHMKRKRSRLKRRKSIYERIKYREMGGIPDGKIFNEALCRLYS